MMDVSVSSITNWSGEGVALYRLLVLATFLAAFGNGTHLSHGARLAGEYIDFFCTVHSWQGPIVTSSKSLSSSRPRIPHGPS